MNRKTATLTTLILLLLVTVCNSTAISQANRKETPLAGFPDATMTIFPVTYIVTGPVDKYRKFYDGMMGPAGREHFKVIEILGLLLTEQGYDKFEMTDTEFRFPTETSARKDRAATFGTFVSELDLKTDYALCTEFTIHLENSFEEVYSVIVDTKGGLVWEDSQGPGDPEFDNDFPGTPEKCCELTYRRLASVMALDRLPKTELAEDKKQALQEMRSGQPPSQSEFTAIEMRLGDMKKAGGFGRVMIYPARVDGDRTDRSSATRLSELINEAGLCKPRVATASPLPDDAGWPDEMEVLWRFASSASEHTRQNPNNCDYVLFADYWFAPDGRVWAVHFVVCDQAGDWVIVDMQNNHKEDFQRVNPKTLADCDRLVLERLKKILH